MGEVGKLPEKRLFEAQRAMVAAKLANLENGQRASSANLPSTPMWGYRTIGCHCKR